MTVRLYDFTCPNGHTVELLLKDGQDYRTVECTTCGLPAQRQIPAPRPKLDPFTGDFTTASDAWERRRNDHMKKEQKHKEQHGTYWIGKSEGYLPKK